MPTFTFSHINDEAWEKAFGKHDPEKFRRAKKEIDAEKAKESEKADEHGPAVHGDHRMYHGWNPGLGCVTHGRTHRREVAKAKGLREAN